MNAEPLLTPRQLRPFIYVGCLGVVTTAINTGIVIFPHPNVAFRDLVLLVHAPATWVPVIGLALLGFRASPFAAVIAAGSVSLEKALEFVGQALRVFPPEEVINQVAVRAVTNAIWDQIYFVLWCCNTLGATSAALLMVRLLPPRLNLGAATFAGLAALCTLVMLLGPEYVGWRIPQPNAVFFFVAFTGYRLALVVALQRGNSGAVTRTA